MSPRHIHFILKNKRHTILTYTNLLSTITPERERDRQTDRQTGRQTQTDRQTETDRQTGKERERENYLRQAGNSWKC